MVSVASLMPMIAIRGRVRLGGCKALIVASASSLAIGAGAGTAAGFGDAGRMRRAFLRTIGQPPQALRRAARATRCTDAGVAVTADHPSFVSQRIKEAPRHSGWGSLVGSCRPARHPVRIYKLQDAFKRATRKRSGCGVRAGSYEQRPTPRPIS